MNSLSAKISNKLKLVSDLFINGQHAQAESVLKALYVQYPKEEIVLKANISFYQKRANNKQAIEFAMKLLQLSPNSYELAMSIATWCLKEKEPHNAIICFQNIIKYHANSAETYFRLALLYKQQGEYTSAVQMFNLAIEKNYNSPEDCYLNLALIHSDFRQESLAIDSLQKLIKLNSEHVLAKLNLATLYQSSGEKDKALQLYQEILQQTPNFTEALVRLTFATKLTEQDSDLLKTLNKRVKSSRITNLEKEGLNYALAKAKDDIFDYASAYDSAKVANTLNRKRIGAFDEKMFKKFIDDSILKFDQHWFAEEKIVSDAEPIFIVGHFRSGSTLVEQILAGHSSITPLGEVDFFLRLFHEKNQEYWNLTNQESLKSFELIKEQYTKLINTMAKGAIITTDKRPENILFLAVIKKIFPNARFIHTRRNLLDNAVSIYFQQLNDLSKFSTSLDSVFNYDLECQKLMEHWKSLFGESIFEVYYEDLVADPKKTIEAMLKFLNLDWQDSCLNFEQRKSYVRTASVDQVRSKIYTSSVGRGGNYYPYLSEAEKEKFKYWVK